MRHPWLFGVCLGAVSASCSRALEGESQGAPIPPAAEGPDPTATAETRAVASAAPGEPDAARSRVAPGTLVPVAVVELFTSEGCSSCPGADQVLARIERWRRASARNVITLAFHVDYWNRLGWRDRFSDRAYSDRQRWYAMQQPEPRLYTPQMIVQGSRGFIGSHEDEARAAIGAALLTPPPLEVGLSAEPLADGAWHVRYRIDPAHARDHLSLALVQDQASTPVTAGENAGETLTHVSVVLAYVNKTVDSGRGGWRVEAPAAAAVSVVAIVQSPADLEVLGANRLALD